MKFEKNAAFKPCIIIPIYNNEKTIFSTIECLEKFEIPGFIINDGSNEETVSVLNEIVNKKSWVEVIHFSANRGKGAVVSSGLAYAREKGYSHALQIDADCQHRFDDVPRFIKLARQNPEALLIGRAIFPDDVPKIRFYGRYLTHFFVWLETLSFAVRDTMCGFRVYPLRVAVDLAASGILGRRMDFDTEIVVRLYWEGVPVINVDTVVTYHPDGISNFRIIWDNVLIFRMHTRLVFGMLLRIPKLLNRKLIKEKKDLVNY